MGSRSKKSAAIPLNTFKQDYNLIVFVGGKGGGGGEATGVTRYTFWLDCDPFDINNRTLISQNVYFEVYEDSGLSIPITPYIIVDQSDDIPDEQVKVGATSQGASVIIPNPAQPPYYLNTQFTSQPVNSQFQNDQGRYSLAGYVGQGTGFGNTQMVGQGFVPKQAKLTGFFFEDLFHTNSTDPTTFAPLVFELWSSSGTFLAHLGKLQPTYNAAVQPAGLTTDSSCTAYFNTLSYNTGTDGNKYWVNINQLHIELTSPVAVTPGVTYYIMVRQSPLGSANYYFLGSNVNSSNVYSGLGRYTAYDLTGAAVSAHAVIATDGSGSFSNLVDANGHPIDFPFVTQGNIGRIAVTFWWANSPTSYWNAPPSLLPGQFKFIHLDFDQRI